MTTPSLAGFGAWVMGRQWHRYRDDHVSLKGAREQVALVESKGISTLFVGSTFFSGIPWLNRVAFGLVNCALRAPFGAWSWRRGKSFLGAFMGGNK